MIIINTIDSLKCGVQTEEFDGSIGEFIVERYYGTSQAYSVFIGTPANETDITFDIDALVNGYEGTFTVLLTPSVTLGVAGWFAIISMVISVAALAFTPDVDIPATTSREQESPNNQLSARSNRSRPLQRIPDIRGTVRSTPDIIMQPYNRYFGQRDKVEIGLYCVGRGPYTLSDIRDGDTPIDVVEGSTYEVYGPYKSKNNSLPDMQTPDRELITEDIVIPYRANAVNGVELIRSDLSGKVAIVNDDIVGYSNGGIGTEFNGNLQISLPGRLVDISPDFYVGNSVNVVSGMILFSTIIIDFPSFITVPFGEFDLSGTHKILKVEEAGLGGAYVVKITTDLFLDDSADISAIGGYAAGDVWDFSMTTEFSTPYNEWYHIGVECDRGYVNIKAPQGLYTDDGDNIRPLTIDYVLEVEPVDINNIPSGTSQTYSVALSANNSIQRGVSFDFSLPYKTRFRARLKRTTERITGIGNIVDFTQFEDLYGLVDITQPHFGDVTTILTRTVSTPSATAVKQRELNCLATERLNKYLGNGVFQETYSDNLSAVQSYIRDFIDPIMGNRPLLELDADGLLVMESEIDAYFGEPHHHGFNYTLDSTDITFQEYTMMLFNCINSVAYRDGSVVKAKFEKADPTPQILFTHKSKMPDSETFSRNMNAFALNDGVEVVWVDPDTDTNEVIYIPEDKSSINPKKMEIPGLRNLTQATKRAWREYNKLLNEKVSVEVTVTADGRYVKPGDVISIVKGTRTNTSDGEVLDVSLDGYTLTLSQDVTFTPGDTHYIILKKNDGSTQSLACTPGTLSNQVELVDLPEESIRTGIDYQRRTEFSFGNEARHMGQLFIARTIDISDQHTVSIRGVNYSDAYYANDTDNSDGFDAGFSNGFD